MKITILDPKTNFTSAQQEQLASVGEVAYMNPPGLAEHPMDELLALAKDTEILAIDPDVFGGFDAAKEKTKQLIDQLPTLKYLALDTTSYGWMDLEYCRNKDIVVSNCPGWSRESVAEQALALLFILAKNIIKLDRKTQKGEYKLEQGMELRGKTLGIIGVGSIGSTLAVLANGIGMKVIGYNHSPKEVAGVEMKNSLEELLAEADAVSLHVTHKDENHNLINEAVIGKMKDGVIIVNVADRASIDEAAMAKALESGKVAGYGYEIEEGGETPLKDIETAIGLRPFAWYTKESLLNLYQVFVDNIIAMTKGTPQNIVS